ncbi:MAG TPA: lipid-binding SYLF domain-containing protein [Vicinamibacterales bacterium]|nr:lipid-binding SYLF domain-containing protein [Vicinamibacterales bacterium]
MSIRTAGLAAVLASFVAASFGAAEAQAQTLARMEDTVAVFDEITTMGDRAIPADLLKKAQCVAIVPGLKKGAFVVGAKYGRGFVSCRTDAGWSAPAGIRMEGGSVGFQIGGTEIDVVLAIMNKRGVDRLLSNQFTLGADASVAAGPLGRTAAAQTDAAMTAEILSWSRSRGVFAGVALEGATLRGDDDANLDLYGKRLEMRQIVTGSTPVPAAAAALISRLSKY